VFASYEDPQPPASPESTTVASLVESYINFLSDGQKLTKMLQTKSLIFFYL